MAAASSMPKTGALPNIVNGSSSGYYFAYRSTALMSASMPSNTALDTMRFSNPSSIPSTSKRKGVKDVSAAPIIAKRSRKHLITSHLKVNLFEVGLLSLHVKCPQYFDIILSYFLADTSTDAQPTSSAKHNNVVNSSAVQLSDPATASDRIPVQGSNVAKSLFNQPIQSPPTNSSGPKTPPRATSSQTDKSISPL
ncbi:hypothetical protein RND71_038622 [Anisodus tanguticus]|uniref:Uncharacterized protein n=1 Tax=Anisodus tanguticus TaxID=243964 RepID=A0AAE1UX73_9SOLA|nr:hypothetical protein RND71_038622 [Anisodus tanguticus]